MPGHVYTTAKLLLGILLLAVPIARMESPPSTSKVSLLKSTVVNLSGDILRTMLTVTSSTVESTSEAASSGDEGDAENLEAILGAVYTSPVKESLLYPAERQSLLLFDKDFAVDLESVHLFFCFYILPYTFTL